MAPTLLFDISGLDLHHVQYDAAAIERINPHRGVMRLLDGINFATPDFGQAVAFKDVRPDEFWVPGHIPGRPLFPGVLMVEAGAQLATYLTLRRLGHVKFMGFVGLDKVKFRGMVVPGDRLTLLCQCVECRPRRSICDVQGVVGGNIVFESRITGMPM
jgi:3-hydroxyacyl-[acyl-carrier-protein] dehydratase